MVIASFCSGLEPNCQYLQGMPVCVSRSVMSNSATPWTVARQAPLSIGFSRQAYWSGLPFPAAEDLPNPGIQPGSPASTHRPPASPEILNGRPHSLGYDAVPCVLSRVRLSLTPWTVAHQAPLSMGFPRQAYWSGLPFPPPWDLPDPGMEPASPVSPVLQAGSLPAEPSGKPHVG